MGSKVTLNGELMFPSDYVAAVELKGRDVTLTIKSVAMEELVRRGGGKDLKPCLTFDGTPKKLVCNKTNADSIASLYGTEAAAWVGKRITLYPTRVQCGREMVDAIRIREVKPKAKDVAPPAKGKKDAQPVPEPVEADAIPFDSNGAADGPGEIEEAERNFLDRLEQCENDADFEKLREEVAAVRSKFGKAFVSNLTAKANAKQQQMRASVN